MIDAVDEVSDIVQVSCDLRHLDIVLAVSHGGQNISGVLRNLHNVGKAMLGKAQRLQ